MTHHPPPSVPAGRVSWRGRFTGRARRPARPDHGYAVRVDWPGRRPGTVSHALSQFTTDHRRVQRRACSTRRFWARGPVQPLAVTVVALDRTAFKEHPRACSSPACPTAATLHGMSASHRRGNWRST